MSVAANKVPGVRAALISDTYSAKMTRRHNDANVLCLGSWVRTAWPAHGCWQCL
jgi:ribose 5-phosphate isomerase B